MCVYMCVCVCARVCACVCACQGTSARAGAALINQILALPYGQEKVDSGRPGENVMMLT